MAGGLPRCRRGSNRRGCAVPCALPGAFPGLVAGLLLCAPGAGADTVTVDVSGIDGELADNVRALLAISRYTDEALSELNIRNLHAQAGDQIRRALRPFGYYEPSVESELTTLGDERWEASYAISPGPEVLIGDVTIEITGDGAGETALTSLRRELAPRAGTRLSHPAYERVKARLREEALSLGYRDAAYTRATLEVDPPERRADIHLTLATGQRYRFGELLIEQDVLSEELIRRYSPFAPGDPFATSELLEFEYRLFDTGYFSSVQLEALAPEADRIPVRLRASPGPRRAWNLRGGYGTDTGPRIGVGYESRRLNRHGHGLRANLELSAPRIEFSSQYHQPLARPANDRRIFQVGVLDQELGDTDSTRYEANVRESRRRGPWNRVRYLRFAYEADDTGGDRSAAQLTIPGYTLVRSDSNNVTFPTRGSYFEADVHGAVGGLLSDTSFVALRLDGRLIRGVGERNRVILRGELGAVAVDDFEQLPATERFFAGGDRSVRGFGLNNIGPRDAEGRVVGGRYLAIASAEYEQRLAGKWGAAVFVDAGDAFNGDSFSPQVGAGFGLRWLSPIGMVRVDLAWPLTTSDDSVRLHFTFGPEL